MGVRVASEGFADRAYNVDGTPGLAQARRARSSPTRRRPPRRPCRWRCEGKVRTIDGVDIDISVQTICCHGDTPGAERIVRAVREALEKAGCQVKPLRDWLPARDDRARRRPRPVARSWPGLLGGPAAGDGGGREQSTTQHRLDVADCKAEVGYRHNYNGDDSRSQCPPQRLRPRHERRRVRRLLTRLPTTVAASRPARG